MAGAGAGARRGAAAPIDKGALQTLKVRKSPQKPCAKSRAEIEGTYRATLGATLCLLAALGWPVLAPGVGRDASSSGVAAGRGLLGGVGSAAGGADVLPSTTALPLRSAVLRAGAASRAKRPSAAKPWPKLAI